MKNIISCSRRTDIPAFYYEWLQDVLGKGSVELTNRYNDKNYSVGLKSENVHCIVLWSKNFAQLVENPGLLENYNLFFQFTITGNPKVLEPGVIDFQYAIKQAKALAERYSPEQVSWRFDPIVLNKNHTDFSSFVNERLQIFEEICREISSYGVNRCTISFMSLYPQVIKRMAAKGILFDEPEPELKVSFAEKLVNIASNYGIRLFSCCDKLLCNFPGIMKASCIDGNYLTGLFGEKASLAHDSGQRSSCGCTRSYDIGAYTQVCHHKCIYCYANPQI